MRVWTLGGSSGEPAWLECLLPDLNLARTVVHSAVERSVGESRPAVVVRGRERAGVGPAREREDVIAVGVLRRGVEVAAGFEGVVVDDREHDEGNEAEEEGAEENEEEA